VTGNALSHHASSPGVALITAQYRMLSQQRPGMLEFLRCGNFRRLRNRCFLADDRMAELTIFADHPAVPADVIAFVTAKAAGI